MQRSSRMSQNGFLSMIATGLMIFAAIVAACLMVSPATAQDQPNAAPAAANMASDTGTALAAELNRHNAEVARILEREQFRYTGISQAVPSSTGEQHAASARLAPSYSAGVSTCNCAVTGVCTCNPATCACAACRNGQLRASQYASAGYAGYGGVSVRYSTPMASYSTAYAGSAPLARSTVLTSAATGQPIGHVTSTGMVDRKGREWLTYSGMSKRQARATAAANH